MELPERCALHIREAGRLILSTCLSSCGNGTGTVLFGDEAGGNISTPSTFKIKRNPTVIFIFFASINR